ncbi:MAG TPA: DUF3078 domain-containing protein [Saprospiraceae bacterium]|nr:DUF3078 domain-containing protein [Saprospiraceae bacterium]
MKRILIVIAILAMNTAMAAQSVDEYRDQRRELRNQIRGLQSQITRLQAGVDTLTEKIDILTGWRLGYTGIFGFKLSSFNNWIKGANPNAVSSNITGAITAHAHRKTDLFFWRNNLNINLGWQKLDLNGAEESSRFQKIADVLRINSHIGSRLNEEFALSGMMEFNTAILQNFNNPGVLDAGVGFTWLPVPSMVLVIHPINYHWVFGDNPDFNNAVGIKFSGDYSFKLPAGIRWRTVLTGFLPYKDKVPSLREYTWTNNVVFPAWKGIGIGLDYSLRNAVVEFDGLQYFFVIGISYTLSNS